MGTLSGEDIRERPHLLKAVFVGTGTVTTSELPAERGNLIRRRRVLPLQRSRATGILSVSRVEPWNTFCISPLISQG